MQRITRVPTFLAAALVLAACGESATGPDAGALSAAEAQTLAAGFGAQDASVLGGFGTPTFSTSSAEAGPSLAVTVTDQFTRTRTCPEGGSVTVQGTRTHTYDRDARSASFQFTATRTENACAWTGPGGATITVNGNPNTQLTASHTVTNGVPGIGTATKKGSFTWTRSTGQSGTCTVDLTQTWDPATHTYTLKGTFCNQTIDLTRTWTES